MTINDLETRARIRTDLDTSFLVEAAAGTGKTQCFVERVVEALATGRSAVDRVAAVTFTRKAAGELRLRIRQELLRRCETDRRPEVEDALVRLEEAQVGTIHGFCADLLRRHPVEAGIDPGFEELDDDAARSLRELALSRWFERALAASDPVLGRVLARLSVGYDTPRAALMRAFESVLEHRDLDAPWASPEAAPDSNPAWALIEKVAPWVAKAAPNQRGTVEYLGLERVEEVAQRWRPRFEAGEVDPVELEADLVALSRALKRPNRIYGAWCEGVSGPEVEETVRQLFAELKLFRDRSDASLAPDLRSGLETARADYEALLMQVGRMDMLGLLLGARDLLRSRPDVRRAEAERLDLIAVDELQDTDPIQSEILLLLSQRDFDGDDWRTVRPDPGRLFMVGDPKQAIYGFRRASMDFYLGLRRQLELGGVERLELSRSFRARAPIQNLVNRVFAPQFGTPQAPAPGQPGYVPILGGPADADGQPSVMLISAQIAEHHPVWRDRRAAAERAMARSTAAFLGWLVDRSGFRVRGDDGELRPVRAGDVAVLFRMFRGQFNRRPVLDLAEALERSGLPFTLAGRAPLAERTEVEVVRTALRAIEWPSDELSVYGALVGPLFAISDESLWAHRNAHGRLNPLDGPDDAAGQGEVFEALAVLRDLSRHKSERSVVETMSRLFDASRAVAGFAHEPSGSEVLAYVELVQELARRYEQRTAGSIRGFVAELDRARTDHHVERPAEEHTDGVRLMTVHAAKGLEFPVVVLADPFTNDEGRVSRFVDPNAGLAAYPLVHCRPKELADHHDEAAAAARAEEHRLGYVAATRARDLLVVSSYGYAPKDMTASKPSWFGPYPDYLRPVGRLPSDPEAMGTDPSEPLTVYEPIGANAAKLPNPIRAGRYELDADTPYVWVSAAHTRPSRQRRGGLAREDALGEGPAASDGRAAHAAWQRRRDAAIGAGSLPSETLVRASEAYEAPPGAEAPVRFERVERDPRDASGPRFGQLVHELLEATPWNADAETLRALAEPRAQALGCPASEIDAAVTAASKALSHPRLRAAASAETVHREWPVLLRTDGGDVLDGVIDLVYFADGRWTVLDYKTGRLDELDREDAGRQVAWYVHAVRRAFGQPVRGIVLQV